MNSAPENCRFQRYIVILGASLMVTKFAAWFITGSVSIFTDAAESVINVAAGLIGLYALYVSAKPRDRDHPYGHGRIEYISASVEGSMISVAGVLILLEALNGIFNPPEISESLDIGIVLIAAAAAANFFAGTAAVRKGKRNRSQALIASGRHLRSDTYSSCGIILGLGAVYVLDGMGYDAEWLDGAIALLFGFIILYTGIKVLKDSFDSIMDKTDADLLNGVVNALNGVRHDDWIDVHDLRIEKHGGMLHMDMHVTLPFMMTVRGQYEELREIRNAVCGILGDNAELSVTGEPCGPHCCFICSRECPERSEPLRDAVEWSADNLSRDVQHAECREIS